MKVHHKKNLAKFSLALGFLFVGCGGSDTPSIGEETVLKTSTVSGTVPGTLIEILCRDGSFYSVNSTDDGTTKHPFSLTLPQDVDCKFIMTTNEKDPDTTKHIVTPLLFNDGTTTSSYFRLTSDTDIGYIDLAMVGAGVQEALTVSVANISSMEINAFSYDPLDIDNDNIPNIYEDDDDDNDGIVNRHDDDDDGDGILDIQDDDYTNDDDGDGIDNESDNDDDNDGYDDRNDDYYDNTIVLPVSYKADTGRLLGSQCAQCHGTNGVSVSSWDSIVGEDDFTHDSFSEYPIMKAQVDGYTYEEKVIVTNWLLTLKK